MFSGINRDLKTESSVNINSKNTNEILVYTKEEKIIQLCPLNQ